MSYARSYRSGSLGEAACPDGQYQSCILAAPGQPRQCNCLNIPPAPVMTAVMTQQASTHWGLIAAGIVAGFVIYKFVL